MSRVYTLTLVGMTYFLVPVGGGGNPNPFMLDDPRSMVNDPEFKVDDPRFMLDDPRFKSNVSCLLELSVTGPTL